MFTAGVSPRYTPLVCLPQGLSRLGPAEHQRSREPVLEPFQAPGGGASLEGLQVAQKPKGEAAGPTPATSLNRIAVEPRCPASDDSLGEPVHGRQHRQWWDGRLPFVLRPRRAASSVLCRCPKRPGAKTRRNSAVRCVVASRVRANVQGERSWRSSEEHQQLALPLPPKVLPASRKPSSYVHVAC